MPCERVLWLVGFVPSAITNNLQIIPSLFQNHSQIVPKHSNSEFYWYRGIDEFNITGQTLKLGGKTHCLLIVRMLQQCTA